MFQHRSEIVGVLPQPPDRHKGPDCLARTLCVSQLVPDLSLLPLKLLHDLPDQNRVDAGGDTPQLRMLASPHRSLELQSPYPGSSGEGVAVLRVRRGDILGGLIHEYERVSE
jgi:hypothetical protein